jgi:hypothetical protein
MTNFYVLAWFLLIAGVLVAAFHGTLTPVAMLVYSIMALGLVFALMIWAVIANERKTMTE